jgi:hypothetical protein
MCILSWFTLLWLCMVLMFGRWKSHIYHVGLSTSYYGICCFFHHGPNLNTFLLEKNSLYKAQNPHPPFPIVLKILVDVCVYSLDVLWCGYQVVMPIMDILKGDEHLYTKGEGWKPTNYLHNHITLWSWINMKGTRSNFVLAYNLEFLWLFALYFQKDRLR